MFSIAPGSWFLSPMFVLGSADPISKQLSIRFERCQFQDLRIRIINGMEEIVLSENLREDIREWEISLACWPKGRYSLFLEDEDKTYSYQLINC